MATDYEYITLAKLENVTGLDYSTIDSVRFADAKVEATISVAEKMVTSYLGKDAAQTVTDGIESATIFISAKLMHNKLVLLEYIDVKDNLGIADMSIFSILRTFLSGGVSVGVDAIPMSGADDYSPCQKISL